MIRNLLLFTFVWCTMLAFSVSAQDKDLNQLLAMQEENTSENDMLALQDALVLLEEEYGVTLVYNSEYVEDKYIPLDIAIEEDFSATMKNLLNPLQLRYQQIGERSFLLEPRQEPIADLSLQETVTGTVTDAETGEPLPGVNILIKNTTTGTSTNTVGEYEVTVPSLTDTLIFSYIGYQIQEIPLQGRNELDVTLELDAITGEEIQVVAYGAQRRESVVGSISTIDVEELRIPSRSISNALAGRMAGVVSVQSTGEPGFDHSDFWIRGVSTFGANRDPLILVDGIERDINGVDVEEIESISILKDATATAVYGVRGANGVVLINTRRGDISAPSISFRSEVGITAPTQMPQFVDAAQFAELYNEARGSDFYSQDIIDTYRNHSDPDLYPNVDWLDALYSGRAAYQRYNLNVSGGTERVRYFVSGSFYDEEGMYRENDLAQYNSNINFQRYNFRSNIDINLTESTELTLGIGDVLTSRNAPGASTGNIWGYAFATSPNVFPVEFSDGRASGPSWGTGENPYNLLVNSGYTDNWTNTVQSILALRQDLYALTTGLSGRVLFSFDKYNTSTMTRSKEVETYLAVGRDENNETIFNRTREGQEFLSYTSQSAGDRRIYLETSLNYERDFGVHNIGGLLLYNQSSYVNTGAGDFETSLPYVHQGIAGRMTYAYASRYFLETNFGLNGSENFAPGNRFGFFPSIAVGWIPTNESFFSGFNNAITWLQLKASHGYVGNDEIGGGRRFIYLSTVNEGAPGFNFGPNHAGHGGLTFGEIGTPDATWEKARMTNFGVELHLFNDLMIQADVFYEKRDKIFLQRGSLPGFMGVSSLPYVNLGVMENKGFDGSAEYVSQIGGVSVSFMGNFSYARNQILENDQPDYEWAYRNRHGQKFGQQFGYIAVGLFESQEEIDQSPTQFGLTNLRPGDIKYLDVNGDGVIDSNDEVPIGYSTMPEIVYGLGSSFAYKGFDFSFMFQGVGNVSRFIGGVPVYPFNSANLGRSNIYEEVYHSRWTVENPSQDVTFPRLSDGPNENNFRPSTWWQRNMSYLRLRNVELGYSLPISVSQSIRANDIRFFMSGMNLLTFSDFDMWDPELNTGNGNVYPISRVINFGISMNF
jgi:TonB-linked SusC/RagA family outer membrane protein